MGSPGTDQNRPRTDGQLNGKVAGDHAPGTRPIAARFFSGTPRGAVGPSEKISGLLPHLKVDKLQPDPPGTERIHPRSKNRRKKRKKKKTRDRSSPHASRDQREDRQRTDGQPNEKVNGNEKADGDHARARVRSRPDFFPGHPGIRSVRRRKDRAYYPTSRSIDFDQISPGTERIHPRSKNWREKKKKSPGVRSVRRENLGPTTPPQGR